MPYSAQWHGSRGLEVTAVLARKVHQRGVRRRQVSGNLAPGKGSSAIRVQLASMLKNTLRNTHYVRTGTALEKVGGIDPRQRFLLQQCSIALATTHQEGAFQSPGSGGLISVHFRDLGVRMGIRSDFVRVGISANSLEQQPPPHPARAPGTPER